MKTILSTLLAAIMLISLLGGCARDMSGETRNTPAATATTDPKASAKPTEKPTASPASTDSTADGVIDEGKDAVDGVVGAGEDMVNDVVGAGEDMVNDVTGNKSGDATDAGSDGGDQGASVSPSPSAGQ